MSLKSIYINNFGCLRNFKLNFKENDAHCVLYGRNGSGKTTVGRVFKIFKRIGLGQSRLADLLPKDDFGFFKTDEPIRLEIGARVEEMDCLYTLAIEFPDGFKRPRVFEEIFAINGQNVFKRLRQAVTLAGSDSRQPVEFNIDWHSVALNLVTVSGRGQEIEAWLQWLKNIMALTPLPEEIKATSEAEVDYLDIACANMADYLRFVLLEEPETIDIMKDFLKRYMPDFNGVKYIGEMSGAKVLTAVFKKGKDSFQLAIDKLSSGEKIFFICALVCAALIKGKTGLIFWDEPDRYISFGELQLFSSGLRKVSNNFGQVIITTNNPYTIDCFPRENVYALKRDSHFEPTRIDALTDIMTEQDDIKGQIILGNI